MCVFASCDNFYLLFLFRGYNIGVRLIDEFLAKSNVSTPGGCTDLKETADVIAKVHSIVRRFFFLVTFKQQSRS